jgi:CheY-like chemotaxis protein
MCGRNALDWLPFFVPRQVRWICAAMMEHRMPPVVLVVDDEPLILELTSAMLEDSGCQVVSADSASAALDLLMRDSRIELLLTDVRMPGMNGYDLAALARRSRPHLRIVVMSGDDRGREGYKLVRKPFSRQQIAEIVAFLPRD